MDPPGKSSGSSQESAPSNNRIEGICSICREEFEDYSRLEKHMLDHPVQVILACTSCNVHLLAVDFEDGIQVCSDCKGESPNWIFFEFDDKNVDPICGHCKARVKKGFMAKHLWSHIEFQPYRCGICPVSYSNYPNLERHMRIQHSLIRRSDNK